MFHRLVSHVCDSYTRKMLVCPHRRSFHPSPRLHADCSDPEASVQQLLRLILLRTISVVMADSGDPPLIACDESPESAMSVRSAELSACSKSFLSVCLNPLVAMPILQLRKFPVQAAAHAGAHHDTYSNFTGGPSAEKK